MQLSIVIPCYNEGANVHPLYDRCREVLEGVVASYELIFINDGSQDDTWTQLKSLYAADPAHLQLINLSRNFGKEAAMVAGLQRAEGDYVTVMDGDLQQPPETALEMVRFLEANPDYDCVAAYQEVRRENWLLRLCKKAFYRLINTACDIPFRANASDFRTYRQPVVQAILSLGEYHRFSKGISSFVGFPTYYMSYRAAQRQAGKTSWSFGSLFRYAFEGITSFSTFPLRIATVAGTLFSVASLVYSVVVVIQKLVYGIDLPGYATIVVLILLIGGVQMLLLGLIGEYVARIFIQSKGRPLYIAREHYPRQENPDTAEK